MTNSKQNINVHSKVRQCSVVYAASIGHGSSRRKIVRRCPWKRRNSSTRDDRKMVGSRGWRWVVGRYFHMSGWRWHVLVVVELSIWRRPVASLNIDLGFADDRSRRRCLPLATRNVLMSLISSAFFKFFSRIVFIRKWDGQNSSMILDCFLTNLQNSRLLTDGYMLNTILKVMKFSSPFWIT